MLSVAMLNVIRLNVVAPFIMLSAAICRLKYNAFTPFINNNVTPVSTLVLYLQA
jgi:hypothetical protein